MRWKPTKIRIFHPDVSKTQSSKWSGILIADIKKHLKCSSHYMVFLPCFFRRKVKYIVTTYPVTSGVNRWFSLKNPNWVQLNWVFFCLSLYWRHLDNQSGRVLSRLAERGFQPDGSCFAESLFQPDSKNHYMTFLISSVRAGTTLNRSSTIP